MRYVIAIFTIIYCINCNGQTFEKKIRIFSTYHGLSNKLVHCITKDDRGFLWIGTGEGLNRFDGKHFLNFFSNQNDEQSLSGNFVYDILQYQPGQLLIATSSGLSVFNTHTNRFENHKITIASLQKKSNTLVRSLFKDKAGLIYVNHSGKIDVFSNTLQYMYSLTDLPWCKSINGIIVYRGRWFQDKTGRIWAPSDNFGVNIIDIQKQQVYNRFNNPFNYPFFNFTIIRSLYYDEEKQKVFCSGYGAGLIQYDLKKNTTKQQLFDIPLAGEERSINAVIEYKNQLLCFGSKWVYSVNPETMEYKNISNGFYDIPSGSLGSSICAYNDGDNIWAGTETKGMIQIPLTESPFVQIKLPFTITNFFNCSSGIIRASNGLLYFAYSLDGLIEVNPLTLSAVQYKNQTGSIASGTIYRICEDEKKRFWVGTAEGIYEFNTQTKQFTIPEWMPTALKKSPVHFLFCDSKGNVWIAYSNAGKNLLAQYDVISEKLVVFNHHLANSFSNTSRITRITEDDNGNIWAISVNWSSMLCYQISKKQLQSYPSKKRAKELNNANGLNAIAVTGNTVWTGNSYGLGLIKYNHNTDSLLKIKRNNGLASDNILAITKSTDNRLFIATQAGIHLLNPANNEVFPLVTKNENIDWSLAYIQYYDSVTNQLFYGLNDRIVMINSDAWKKTKSHLPVFINTIKINNANFELPGSEKTIKLKNAEKNISIDFSAVNYNDDDALTYSYMMEGADKNWIMSGETVAANFSSLSPGTYRFKVKAKLQTGEWGPVNETLRFIIKPPFWQTAWFILCGLLLTGGLIFWLVRRRIKNIRREAELKHKLTEAEMNALRAQMNPHFIFNSLNAIDNLVQTNQKEKATTYLARFAKLIRNILDSSKNNVVPFQKDYETLQLYLQMEQFRCSNKFAYELKADEELLNGDYKVPPLIVQPFVENAIHHGLLNKQGTDKKITVQAVLENDCIRYTVHDNGIGRKKAQLLKEINRPEYQSYGTNITKERIDLYNQNSKGSDVTITDLFENNQPTGTRVEVKLKIF
jgi:ligand-binding sensor domain-containing protein